MKTKFQLLARGDVDERDLSTLFELYFPEWDHELLEQARSGQMLYDRLPETQNWARDNQERFASSDDYLRSTPHKRYYGSSLVE